MELDILNSNAAQIVAAVKGRKIRATDILNAYYDQIDRVNPVINAVVQINRELAYRQAEEIDKNVEKFRHKKLLGVPFTVKNTCAVQGYQPDKGCIGLVGQESKMDATVVARLRQEGALLLGLTNTPELSIGYETDNLLYGQTKNPFDLGRSSGGSSGGESAIIAARGSLIGIGSDASGSLRVPAHSTGIAALKMTQGRVPLTGHIPLDCMGLFSQFISFGPMARTVEDLNLIAPIMVGPDALDAHVVPVLWRHMEDVNLSQLKVAFYTDDGIAVASKDIADAVKNAAYALRPDVAAVTECRPECLSEMDVLLSNSILLGGDEGEWLSDIFRKLKLDNPSPLLLEFYELAKKSKMSITELRWNWVRFDQYRRTMLQFMADYDVILCPVAATTAKLHGQSYKEVKDFSYSMCYSLVNWPVVVVNIDQSSEGLPIGIQVVAHPWREDVALAVARHLECTLGTLVHIPF
ncbi:amidase [Photorhabdus africana]|uniref:amidase n=1 Tax=Photorhabdus africana TaxID=3097554 RepID=UPI002B40D436|nr:amidase [Photorhabdus sp. CRI-LC]